MGVMPSPLISLYGKTCLNMESNCTLTVPGYGNIFLNKCFICQLL